MRPALLFSVIATVTVLVSANVGAATPGETLRDCPNCPELVVIPAGSFKMGDPTPPPPNMLNVDEKAVRPVSIAKPFAIGKYEITFAEWDACVAEGGCTYKPDDKGWGRGKQPVVNISFREVQPFLNWLSKKTGKTYRLPTEAEWEYAARGGTASAYPWGEEIGQNNAACAKCGSQWDDKQPAPVGSFKPNAYGVHDMAGNVTEWVADCYVYSYVGVPKDGYAFENKNCQEHAARGGSWHDPPKLLASFSRQWFYALNGFAFNGLRVARSLE